MNINDAGMEWQTGKTVAVITFVKEAEAYLASLPNAKFAFDTEMQMTKAHEELRNCILEMKSGVRKLTGWLTVGEFLATVSGKE